VLVFGEILVNYILDALALLGSLVDYGVFWVNDDQLFDLGEFSLDDCTHHCLKPV
jgi:hypothetical protein